MSTDAQLEEFGQEVAEFCDDLETFATGEYLRPEEKTFWEPLFPVEAIGELRILLMDLVREVLDTPAEGAALSQVLRKHYRILDEYNSRYADAVLEPEEKSQIMSIVHKMCAAQGLDSEDAAALPDWLELDEEDDDSED